MTGEALDIREREDCPGSEYCDSKCDQHEHLVTEPTKDSLREGLVKLIEFFDAQGRQTFTARHVRGLLADLAETAPAVEVTATQAFAWVVGVRDGRTSAMLRMEPTNPFDGSVYPGPGYIAALTSDES